MAENAGVAALAKRLSRLTTRHNEITEDLDELRDEIKALQAPAKGKAAKKRDDDEDDDAADDDEDGDEEE